MKQIKMWIARFEQEMNDISIYDEVNQMMTGKARIEGSVK
jgi:hypothetical protein